MNIELDKKLVKNYPKLFVNRYKPMTETAMCFGFECGDGWYKLLNLLCHNIQNHIDFKERKGISIPQVTVDQVKEKFGTLSFYYTGGDEYTSGLISMATSMSGIICEHCGNEGRLRGHTWLYTACDLHTKPQDLDTEEEILTRLNMQKENISI